MSGTTIEWTDATWNPTRGCSRVSPGCDHCYAMGQAHRFGGEGMPYEGLTRRTSRGVDWSGRVRLVPEILDQPLRWRKPRRIFVNSMSDLFHESLAWEDIAAVFGVMAACPQHTFQVLTKRPKRMRAFFERVDDRAAEGFGTRAERLQWLRFHAERRGLRFPSRDVHAGGVDWPPAHVWLGVSAEDQRRWNERVPVLQETPAAVRFISAEPLLEGIRALAVDLLGIHQVIVGGESGPGARPCNVDWIRSIVRQCREAGVAAFVKQVGANVHDRNDVGFEANTEVYAEGPRAGRPVRPESWPDHVAIEHDPNGYREDCQGAPVRVHLRDRKGGSMAEWPEDLRVREFPQKGASPTP